MLRPYQTRAIEQVRAAFTRHSRIMLAAATGCGKTTIAADAIQRTLARNRRVLFLVHRVELLEQASARLDGIGVEHGVIFRKRPQAAHLPCQVASIQTLARRKLPAGIDLVILDEAHHCCAQTWRDLLAKIDPRWVLGLSATPARLDGRPLRDLFDEIVSPVTTAELIRDGFLCAPTIYAPPGPSLTGVRTIAGDYEQGGLSLAMRAPALCGRILEHYQRLGHAPAVGFAVDVEHSETMAAQFNAAGIPSASIDGKTDLAVRAARIAALQDGTLAVLWNCQILTEGTDIPALATCIVARPTQSLVLHRQMLGRIMRPKERATVLDHAGNTGRHGTPMDEIEWSLDGKPKVTAAAPLRMCPECYAMFPIAARQCPCCGWVPPTLAESEAKKHEESDEKLMKFGAAEPVKGSPQEKAYRTLLRKATDRGNKIGSARYAFRETFRVWPNQMLKDWAKIEEEEYQCSGFLDDGDKPEAGFPRTSMTGVCARCRRKHEPEPAQ